MCDQLNVAGLGTPLPTLLDETHTCSRRESVGVTPYDAVAMEVK
jgi:hypothetical protein